MSFITDLADLEQRLGDSPFQRFLRLHAQAFDRERGEVQLHLPFRPEYARQEESRQVHGGVIAALIDIAGDYALAVKLGHFVPTIDLRVDFLRPAQGNLTVRAWTVRAGRSVGFVDIVVYDADDRPVANGRGLYATRQG